MIVEFIQVSDRLPPYGDPVLIKIAGVVQYVTYTLDGADETPDWFEPYFFEHDNDQKIWCNKVESWAQFQEWGD